MANGYDYDLAVVGAGPGGYVAAIRASQLGLKAAVIERDKPGGVCLNIGCIPSKSLIHHADIFLHQKDLTDYGVKVDTSAFDYSKVYQRSRDAADSLSQGVRGLLKKNKVDLISGEARFVNRNELALEGGERKKVTADKIIIASGGRPREIPGFEFDEERVLSSTGLLYLQKLPRRMVIMGGGYIGMEFAFVMNAFGVDVTVVEMLPRILPASDAEVTKVVRKAFEGRGITFKTGTKVESMKKTKSKLTLTLSSRNGEETVDTDSVLVAIGRVANTENLGLENIGVRPEKGVIPVKDYYQTSVGNVFAIGDVVGTPPLAHVASKEGEIVAEYLGGKSPEKRVSPDEIPAAVYSEPQVAYFGPNEEEAKERGLNYKSATFPYRGAGKSVAIEKSEGLVKILYDPDTHEIFSAHIVGKDASELIHELLLAKKSELLPEDVATMIHAHPTLSEAVMESARAAEGWVIHA